MSAVPRLRAPRRPRGGCGCHEEPDPLGVRTVVARRAARRSGAVAEAPTGESQSGLRYGRYGPGTQRRVREQVEPATAGSRCRLRIKFTVQFTVRIKFTEQRGFNFFLFAAEFLFIRRTPRAGERLPACAQPCVCLAGCLRSPRQRMLSAGRMLDGGLGSR